MPETAKQPPLYSDKNRDQLVVAVLKRDREVKLLSHDLLGEDDLFTVFDDVEKAVETPKQTIPISALKVQSSGPRIVSPRPGYGLIHQCQ